MRGFSLLEVMVAVAILGMSLTVILSAQVGLFSSGGQAQRMSVALGLGRCKMTELEERFLKLGYPEVDENDEGACCNDDRRADFSCVWKIERVELPQPSLNDPLAAAVGSSDSPGGGLAGLASLASGLGAPTGSADTGALMAGLQGSGTSGLSGMLNDGAGASAVSGLAPMLFSMVYPTIKPMLESSIRRVTVTVKCRDGLAARDLEVLQWVTNPTRGGFLSDVVDSTGGAASGFGSPPGLPGAGATPSPGGRTR